MPEKISVTVKLFSHARYHLGADQVSLKLPEEATVSDVIDALIELGGENLSNIPFRIARNHRFATRDEPVGKDDELACIPPVQGG